MKELRFPGVYQRVWVLKNKRRFDKTKPYAFDLSKRKLILRKTMPLIHQSENIPKKMSARSYQS
jgi:hypothetical protein